MKSPAKASSISMNGKQRIMMNSIGILNATASMSTSKSTKSNERKRLPVMLLVSPLRMTPRVPV